MTGRFKSDHVVTFRVGSASERIVLDRIATDRKMSRSELMRSIVRRLLIEELGMVGKSSK